MRDLFFGGLEYGMRTLLGRKYQQDRIETYVEAIVAPLWESMQVATLEDPSPAAGLAQLEAVCKRLENVAENIEKHSGK